MPSWRSVAAAVGVDDGVVALGELGGRDLAADLDVAEEAEAVVAPPSSRRRADDVLDLGVVGRDAGAHEAERRRQAVEHVDLDRHARRREQGLGGVEAGRAGADDRGAKRVVGGPEGAHESARAGLGAYPRRGIAQAIAGSERAVAAPSSASSARPTDIATQVKIGVSRRV